MNKAVFWKIVILMVLLCFLSVRAVMVWQAKGAELLMFLGVRLLFIILLGWAFFAHKLRWLAWGLVVACGFGVRYVNGVVPSVKIEIIKNICVDMNWEYDEKIQDCIVPEDKE
ncbi:MAG: hypothetical protein J6C85_02490 [Alphaproteobacteria bacterium]|nr:hypothetical protein [Alphaproteobacteria bacterium]